MNNKKSWSGEESALTEYAIEAPDDPRGSFRGKEANRQKDSALVPNLHPPLSVRTLEEPRIWGKAVGSFLQKQAMHNDRHSYKHVGDMSDMGLKWDLEYGLWHRPCIQTEVGLPNHHLL